MGEPEPSAGPHADPREHGSHLVGRVGHAGHPDPALTALGSARRTHRYHAGVIKSAAVERWFASTKPPSEPALRRVREIILGADPSMRERVQYGITFSSTKSGDFAAFVRYGEPGV